MEKNNQKVNFKPKVIPFYERILQIFLVALTAVYALWVIGALQFLWSEYKAKSNPAPIIVFVIAFLMIFGYYLVLIFTNRKSLEESFQKRTPPQRYWFYLKIVLIWIVLIIMDMIIY